ncbi:MAG: hypothetical protein WBL50_15700 [Candidatus Acidiferrum sp.]
MIPSPSALVLMDQHSFIISVIHLPMPAIGTLDALLGCEILVIHSLKILAVNPPTAPC